MGPEDGYFPGDNNFLFKDPVDPDEEENDRYLNGDHEWEEKNER
ncbi:hypothetical protein OXT66_03090 [Lentilactobacillus senioris]|nr:hypothetical protein [Lentilactobacillus senioris]MCY9806534.1 hypothetical protein [Lentilactobacillus senioris]